jgi:hypothetical protein
LLRLLQDTAEVVQHASAAAPNNSLFQYVRPIYLWHALCRKGDMRLNNRILQHLSQELLNGNPFWGLVVANEYLSPREPLHAALVRYFRQRVGESLHSPLAQQLMRGARFCELAEELAKDIGPREARATIQAIPRRAITHPRVVGCRTRRPTARAKRAAPRSLSTKSPLSDARERSPGVAHTVSLIR